MAIKYNTTCGARHINMKAISLRDFVLKPRLNGLKCKICKTDTIISFKQHDAYIGSGSVDWVIDACCEQFEAKIYEKLSID